MSDSRDTNGYDIVDGDRYIDIYDIAMKSAIWLFHHFKEYSILGGKVMDERDTYDFEECEEKFEREILS